MTIWQQFEVQNKICDVLADVTIVSPDGHHFGRPFMTSYQLAIKFDQSYPEVAQAVGVEVGGAGTGRRDSLANIWLGSCLTGSGARGSNFL